MRRKLTPTSKTCRGKVGCAINKTNQPTVVSSVWVSGSRRVGDAELRWPRQVGTVRTFLVPTLYSGTNRAQDDGEVHGPWMRPPVCSLSLELLAFIVGDTWNGLVVARVLCDQGTLLEQSSNVSKSVTLSKCGNLVHELVLRNAGERIADSEQVLG